MRTWVEAPTSSRNFERAEMPLREGAAGAGLQVALEARGPRFIWKLQ